MRTTLSRLAALGAGVALVLRLAATPALAQPTQEEKSLSELRNTVVNLLQALVEKGVMTREQAEGLVKQAQDKAAADATAAAQVEAAEADAVRVTHVPEIVKLELKNQVAQEVKPQVVSEVLATARNEKWGVPGALPEWVSRVRVFGDIRVREQSDLFAEENIPNTYVDFLAVNDAGGFDQAGEDAFINTTEDRDRLRARVRLGVEAEVSRSVRAGIRLSTGNLPDAVSTNQTLANTGGRYQIGVDQAYIRWDARASRNYPWMTLMAGRTPNPYFYTDLLFDDDLSFEGVATTLRLGLSSSNPRQRFAFLTLGAHPIQEIELSGEDKWLLGGQLGLDWTTSGGARWRIGAGIYDYENIVGQRNAPDETTFDFTAPQFLQRGNILFDIRNEIGPTSAELFALAADYTVVDVALSVEIPFAQLYRVSFTGDALRNIAYDEQDVLERTGFLVEERADGYQGELAVGTTALVKAGQWRAFMGYRYLERDAVLDAFTDSDFRGGGTDVKGYYFGGAVGLTDNTWLRVRWLSGDEIDDGDDLFSPPFGLDVLQVDFNTQF